MPAEPAVCLPAFFRRIAAVVWQEALPEGAVMFPPTIGGSAYGFGALARIDQKSHRATPPVCRGPSAGSPPRDTVKSDGRMWRTVCATQRKAFRFLVECSASRAAVVPEAMIGRTVVVSRFTVGQRGVFRAAGHRWSEGSIPGMLPGIPDDPPVGILFGEFSP